MSQIVRIVLTQTPVVHGVDGDDAILLAARHPYVKVLGTGQKKRVVYVRRRAQEALLAYRTFVRPYYTNDPNEKRFFCQREGKPLKVGTMQKVARIGLDAKGPRLHPHLLRHTSARSILCMAGMCSVYNTSLGTRAWR